VDELRGGIDAHHRARPALNNGRLAPVAVQVLRDVVAAVTRAENESLLAAPVVAVGVVDGMHHIAFEVLQPRQVRNTRETDESVREDEMPRMERTLGS